MKWTKGQQAIIDARDCEVLVSAAAGSGKTTVLVERIYQRLIDRENPVDIDRFVVVTFTNAAAAEMKERIRNRMEKALKEETLNDSQRTHLHRQLRLVAGAHISTVHSFCSYVIGQYFHRIGIDPSFSMATESEIRLLRQDVAGELIRDEYEEGREDFLRIAGLFSLNRFDTRLEEWILQIYDKSISEPFPDLLLKEWERMLATPVDNESSPYLSEMVRQEADIARGIYERCLGLEKELYTLEEKYFRTITLLKDISERMKAAGEGMRSGSLTPLQAYEEIRLALMSAEFRGGLPKESSKQELEEACRLVKPLRVAIEDQKKNIVLPLAQIEQEREQMAETCLTFLRLVQEFTERFSQAKRERGIADFNDLEQFALRILYDRDEDNGYRTRSDAARELADSFIEVMIDEYQDSNRVQDTILWAVSKVPDGIAKEGKPPWECLAENRFMVGDIKQSIYRFRNACPELFEKKMRVFSEKGEHRLLGLQNNFRSARPVIDATNAVFREVMHEDIGGVEYDREAELTFSADIAEPEKGLRVSDRVEIDEIDEIPKYNIRVEAKHIAGRILEMVEGDNPLYIRSEDGYRPVRYRDIVILSRAVSPIAYDYAEVFRQYHVPFYTKQKEGFYGSREISLMLQMLAVIDNPRQDIPLAGVITSPMFGMTEEMMAEIHIRCPLQGSYDLYDRLVWAGGSEADGLNEETRECVRLFFSLLTELREKAPFTTISALVEDIYQRTGIYDYFAERPDGERRSGNLDYLLHIVTQYERGSFSGVHAFVEYVGQMISREGDEGEPLLIGEQEDVVRLMTMHKSKGLEFPVVIIPRMSSDGTRSEGGRFVMDADLGIAGYVDDIEGGFRRKPVLYRLLMNKNRLADQGELLRLFYVAMTRAKDQLIVVRWGTGEEEADNGYFARSGMWSFFSMMYPAIRRDSEEKLFRVNRIAYPEESQRIDELSATVYKKRMESANIFDTTKRYTDTVPALEKKPGEEPVPAKISVSDLKKASLEEEPASEEIFRQKASEVDDIPGFMSEDKKTSFTGAERGTIYHQVMATADFRTFSALDPGCGEWTERAEAELDRLLAGKYLRPAERECVKVEDLVTFFAGGLGQRMIAAAVRGKLHREQPFILSKSSREISLYTDRPESEVMIQGIIDGYFEEEDGIVLMDYKTDYIDGEDDVLIRRYEIQLKLYKEALEKLTEKKVKECWLYSFSRGREIRMKEEGFHE